MTSQSAELTPPRIAIVDDESQIHASLRLRLGKDHELISFFDAQAALEAVAGTPFDLCLVDIHMPGLDGLAFVAAAARADPALGFVVLSAFDSDDNLRRTIPLQVYDFVSKPLPEREGFEARIPEWIARTRKKRREQMQVQRAGRLDQELDSARLERDVELVASESARDALLQTASLLTTVHAHLVTATSLLSARAKTDPSLLPLLRNLETGRRTAEAAAVVAEGFFDSAYGSRDSSPALIESGISHAIGIASRLSRADESKKTTDVSGLNDLFPVRGLSGIDFLLMMVPALGLALAIANASTTVRVRGAPLARLDLAPRDARFKNFLWLNRRAMIASHPGVLITVAAAGPSFPRNRTEAWIKGDDGTPPAIAARGLVHGIQKSKGLLGLAVTPANAEFQLALALPT